MSKYIHFTNEQKHRANSVDLADFLRSQGETVTRCGSELQWQRHDSVMLRGNCWYQHSEEKGGLAIDFVRKFYNLNFPDAVQLLLNGEQGAGFAVAEKAAPMPKEFALPEPHTDTRRVFAYLMKERCIDREIIRHFAHKGLLYEDKQYHNAVFVGVDENDAPCHAHKRSTYTKGESFRVNVESCDARHSFHHVGTSDRLYCFEAPIDMLSFLSLYPKNWQQHSYVALCGVSSKPIMWLLEQYPHINQTVLCLDNDAAGQKASQRISEKLMQAGYENVSRLSPCEKDWNEDLCSKYMCNVSVEVGMSMR